MAGANSDRRPGLLRILPQSLLLSVDRAHSGPARRGQHQAGHADGDARPKVPLAKRLYIVKDCKREADRLEIPFGHICDPVGRGVERCLAVFAYAEREGKAYTFVTPDDHELVRALERRFGMAIPRRTVDMSKTIPLTTDRSRPSGMDSAEDNQNRPPRAGSQRGVRSHQQETDGANRDNNRRRRRSRRPSFKVKA